MPMPPSAAEKRLSRLSSRLSPIRKTWPAGTLTGPKSSAARRDLVEHGVARPAGQGLAVGWKQAIGLTVAVATDGVAGGTTLHGLLALIGILYGASGCRGNGAAVEDQLAAANLDGVAGKPDDALDQVRVLARMAEHDDVAALRAAARTSGRRTTGMPNGKL